ncbi:Carbohydrate sulfotransferase 14 [Porphyridium purpureum]|uniref:Carbohydrate sulfotransferase 14 n=1 Tax=Porphyridium purpureum TaxID=35688 RepID=A0A5J4YVB4_PORPP|nr:Carbohydrate sulfotransferase 14 [Porphyridium purpureum]|eukprot:POR2941..scf227_4
MVIHGRSFSVATQVHQPIKVRINRVHGEEDVEAMKNQARGAGAPMFGGAGAAGGSGSSSSATGFAPSLPALVATAVVLFVVVYVLARDQDSSRYDDADGSFDLQDGGVGGVRGMSERVKRKVHIAEAKLVHAVSRRERASRAVPKSAFDVLREELNGSENSRQDVSGAGAGSSVHGVRAFALPAGAAGYTSFSAQALLDHPDVEHLVQLPASVSKDVLHQSVLTAYENMRGRSRYPGRKVSARELRASAAANRIIVSEKSRLIYCPVPKVANSNFKMLIRKFEGFEDYADLLTAHSRARSGLRFLSSYSVEEVEALMKDPTFLKFVFVRNPLDRVLSCYLNKIVNKDPKSEEYATYLGQLYGWRFLTQRDYKSERKPSFQEFVNAISLQSPWQMNEHWALQSFLCSLDVFPYDFVGRFENMSADAELVLQAVGRVLERFPSQKDIKFLANEASKKINKYYSPQIMERVRNTYACDFRSMPEYATPRHAQSH